MTVPRPLGLLALALVLLGLVLAYAPVGAAPKPEKVPPKSK